MICKLHKKLLKEITRVIHKGGSKNIKLLPKRNGWDYGKNRTEKTRYEYQPINILKNGKKIGEAGFTRKPGKRNWTMDFIETP